MSDYVDLRPDVERIVIDLLRVELGIAVSGSFAPIEEVALPSVLVHRAGGGVTYPNVIDAAVIGLDIIAEDKETAWDLTAGALEFLTSIQGRVIGEPEPYAWVSAIEDAGATLYLPDEKTGRARYSAVVRVYARGESSVAP